MLHLHLSRLVKTLPCFQRVTIVLSESQTNKANYFTQCRFRTQSSDVVKVNVLEHTEYSCMKDKLAAEEEGGTIGPLGKVYKSSGFTVLTLHNEQVCKHILDSGLIVVQKMLYLNALSLTAPNNSRLVNGDNLLKPFLNCVFCQVDQYIQWRQSSAEIRRDCSWELHINS